MLKTVYFAAWAVFAMVLAGAAYNGPLSGASMVAFSLTALALFYALALWTVFEQTREHEPVRS